MKIYITKYFFKRGIVIISEEEMHQKFDIKNDSLLISVRNKPEYIPVSWYHKPDWHLTLEEAEARTLEMINKEITSCERKLKRLNNLKSKI